MSKSNHKKNSETNKTSNTTTTIASLPSKNLIDVYLGKNTIYLTLGLLVLLATWAYGSFWFTDKVFLFKDIGSDAINAAYPMYYVVAENWENEGYVSQWSFSSGVGQNVLLQNMGDPFVWLMYFFGKDNIIHMIGIIEPLKVILSGLVFYAYLRTMQLSYFSALFGALCYSFSGFMMIGSAWYVFTIEGLYFALLLYSFEQYLQKGKWLLFPFVICLMGIWQPVDLFLMALIIATYGTVRILDQNNLNWVDLLKRFMFLGCLGLLGILIGAFMILPSLDLMANSPRVLGGSSFFDTLRSKSVFEMANSDLLSTTKARWISTDLLKDENNFFRGAMNYLEAPASFAGMSLFILVPMAFQQMSNRKRIFYGSFLALYLIPLVFPYLRYSFWLYTGDYYRLYSLFVIIAMLYSAVNALNEIYKAEKFPWIGYCTGALLLFYMIFSIQNSQIVVVNEVARNFTVMFALAYLVCIALLSNYSLRNRAAIFMLLILIIELGSGAYSVHNNRTLATASEFEKDKLGYNDYSRDAVDWIKTKDKSYFRVEKNYPSYNNKLIMHASTNDAKVQGYWGTKSYHSFNNLNYVRFLSAMDIINEKDENQTRWISGVGMRPMISFLLGNKYFLSNQSKDIQMGFGYEYRHTVGDVSIFENPNFVPFGFTYSRVIPRSEFNKLDKGLVQNIYGKKDIALLKACVVEDEDLKKIDLPVYRTDTINAQNFPFQQLIDNTKALRAESFEMTDFKNDHFKGKIKISGTKKILFFSMPEDKGWSVKVDGKAAEILKVNIGFAGILLSPGEHTVEMIYNTPRMQMGIWISIAGLIVLIAIWFILNKLNRKSTKSI
jgi:uncharacterized membrane protein YfhO